MSYFDYIASSNNSVNDNQVNMKKARSTLHQLKKLLKPVFALIKKNRSNTYRKSPQPDYESEVDQNRANELLEERIFEDINRCEEFAGVPVYSNGCLDIIPVFRGQRYIPVHFARTEAGTFFWTSMVGPDCDVSGYGDQNAITECQLPELQVPCDRWAQA